MLGVFLNLGARERPFVRTQNSRSGSGSGFNEIVAPWLLSSLEKTLSGTLCTNCKLLPGECLKFSSRLREVRSSSRRRSLARAS